MSSPNNYYLSPVTGSSPFSLLSPSDPAGRSPRSLEGTSLTGHHVPLKCRTPNRVPSPVPPATFISALDHLSTKLRVPMSAVERTQALEDDGLVPGICRLYLEGRCRQGERCFQVHANPMVVEQLRQEALSTPSCCLEHGAECSYEGFPLGLTVMIEPPRERGAAPKANAKMDEHGLSTADDARRGSMSKDAHGEESEQAACSTLVSLHSLCPTNYLWSLYTASGEMHLRAPRNKICREHRKGLCRFGSACSFLHVCRRIPLNRGRGAEATDTPVSTPLLSPPVGKQSARSFGQMSQSDHFGGHGSHFANGSSVPMHSFVDQSVSFSRPGSKPLLTPTATPSSAGGGSIEPLLRPEVQPRSPQLSPSVRRPGSFSHNPYAAASSLQ